MFNKRQRQDEPEQWLKYNLMSQDSTEEENKDTTPQVNEIELVELFNGTLLITEDN